MLYVTLDFENNLTVDALVVSGVFVSAIAHNVWDTIEEKAPNIILKIDDPPIFPIQVANRQLGTQTFSNGQNKKCNWR